MRLPTCEFCGRKQGQRGWDVTSVFGGQYYLIKPRVVADGTVRCQDCLDVEGSPARSAPFSWYSVATSPSVWAAGVVLWALAITVWVLT